MSKHNSNAERRRMLLAASAALVSALGDRESFAQDAAKTRPGAYRVVFENDRMRVLEFRSRPGMALCGVGKHSHPAHLTVALSDARVRVTLQDGREVVATNKLCAVFWREPETHVAEHIGSEARAL